MARDIRSGLPSYEELVKAAGTEDPRAVGIGSGLSGLLTGMQLRRQTDADKASRLAAAEKQLLERSQAYRAQKETDIAGQREERLAAQGAEKSKAEQNYKDELLKLKRDELEYKKHLLNAHSSGNTKDIFKAQEAFDKTYNQPLQDAQSALDEFKQRYEEAIKEGSVGIAAGSAAQLKSAVTGGKSAPAFTVFRKATKTLVPSLQKGLGINRTSTAEINALTKGVPSGFEDPNVGKQFIKTVQDVLDRKKRENQRLINQQVQVLKTGNLPDISTLGEPSNPMDTSINSITKPPLETFMSEEE